MSTPGLFCEEPECGLAWARTHAGTDDIISVLELVTEIPADAQFDDLGIEMAAFEAFCRGSAACSPGPIHEGSVEHLPKEPIGNRTR
jgi:hypothetical protein